MPVNYNTAPESEITLLDIYDSNITSVLQSLGTGQQLLEPSWSGTDGVIPFAMERISLNPYGRQFLVGHLDPGFITVGIQLRLDMQPGVVRPKNWIGA